MPNTRLHFALRHPVDEHDWVFCTAGAARNGDEFVEGLIELVARLGMSEYT